MEGESIEEDKRSVRYAISSKQILFSPHKTVSRLVVHTCLRYITLYIIVLLTWLKEYYWFAVDFPLAHFLDVVCHAILFIFR